MDAESGKGEERDEIEDALHEAVSGLVSEEIVGLDECGAPANYVKVAVEIEITSATVDLIRVSATEEKRFGSLVMAELTAKVFLRPKSLLAQGAPPLRSHLSLPLLHSLPLSPLLDPPPPSSSLSPPSPSLPSLPHPLHLPNQKKGKGEK